MKVVVFLIKTLLEKEVSEMLVRLFASEIILERITIDDVPKGLRRRVAVYIEEIGYSTEAGGN